jgi:hypothetical protein
MKTVRADYASNDWIYQVTFRTPDNAPDDIIFIGLGEGIPDNSFFGEPRNSLNFRIHQGQDGWGIGWRVDVVAHNVGAFQWTHSRQGIGFLPSPNGGTFAAQIRKTGSQLIFEILDTEIAVTIPDLNAVARFPYAAGSRLFFGNASSAYSFGRPQVLPSPKPRPQELPPRHAPFRLDWE